MHFDDRLATVLRQRAASPAIARIQYRQLLDLLGTLPNEARGEQIDAAFDRLAELSGTIAAGERSAILATPGLRLRSARLVAALAEGDTSVASAAIVGARLDENEWLDLAPALAVHARGLMRSRRDLGPKVDRLLERLGIRDRALPSAQADAPSSEAGAVATAEAGTAEAERAPSPSGIGAIVRRIEEFRKNRQPYESTALHSDAPRLPLGDTLGDPDREPVSCLDFATDAGGRVVWADAGIAPALVGMRLDPGDLFGPAKLSPAMASAMRHHQPIEAGGVVIAGGQAVAGKWRVDATPRFDPAGGRFGGYVGRMRRLSEGRFTAGAKKTGDSEAERMRQLLHELRTPVNAIQGFAEVIQQQLFGPTPHEYRALAAGIAGDAARLLAGFEELDRLARLDSAALELEPGSCDIAEVLRAAIERLAPFTAPRESGFELKAEPLALAAAIAPVEAERLLWRLLATLAGAAVPGERTRIRLRQRDGELRISLHLPASLAALAGDSLFQATASAQPQALTAGTFGIGFTLRLAAAEARAAGGSLERRGDRLRLVLPGLTMPDAGNSLPQVDGGTGG